MWRSGCGDPTASKCSSSAIQLPILAALYAGSPTLYPFSIQEMEENVNMGRQKIIFYRKALKIRNKALICGVSFLGEALQLV